MSPLILFSWKSFRTFMEKRPYPGSKFSTFIPFIAKNLAPLIWPKHNSHPCQHWCHVTNTSATCLHSCNRVSSAGQVQDPGRCVQEHAVLAAARLRRGGPWVAVRPVPGRTHHPPGPRHHEQDRDLGLAAAQHPRTLRRQGQGGGQPRAQAGGLAQPPHLPGQRSHNRTEKYFPRVRKRNVCNIFHQREGSTSLPPLCKQFFPETLKLPLSGLMSYVEQFYPNSGSIMSRIEKQTLTLTIYDYGLW